MTKKELLKYRWLKKNIEKLENELLEIDTQLRRITVRYEVIFAKSSPKDILGNLIVKKVMVENEINKKLEESYELLHRIEKAIEVLPEREQYLIRARYIEGKTWEEISGEMEYALRHVYRLHKEALKELQKVVI